MFPSKSDGFACLCPLLSPFCHRKGGASSLVKGPFLHVCAGSQPPPSQRDGDPLGNRTLSCIFCLSLLHWLPSSSMPTFLSFFLSFATLTADGSSQARDIGHSCGSAGSFNTLCQAGDRILMSAERCRCSQIPNSLHQSRNSKYVCFWKTPSFNMCKSPVCWGWERTLAHFYAREKILKRKKGVPVMAQWFTSLTRDH